jgi:hypothetical protein
MQIMIWFAGLRGISNSFIISIIIIIVLIIIGALAFALSNNMPEEHRDLYVSTTLSIVIFTTIIIGGLTEPMLNYTRMRMIISEELSPTSPRMDYSRLMNTPDPTNKQNINDITTQDENLSDGIEGKIMYGFMYHFEKEYMQPFFGTPNGKNDKRRETEMVNST